MAKKSEAKTSSAVGRKSLEPKSSPGSTESRPTKNSLPRRTGEGRGEGRPSSLLDTRVIYCGDNLEQAGRRQKCEGRRTKSARLKILPSTFQLQPFPAAGSFYYHCDWHAGHYVKVMLDQILRESNFMNEIIHAY